MARRLFPVLARFDGCRAVSRCRLPGRCERPGHHRDGVGAVMWAMTTALFQRPERAVVSYRLTFARAISCRAPDWCKDTPTTKRDRASLLRFSADLPSARRASVHSASSGLSPTGASAASYQTLPAMPVAMAPPAVMMMPMMMMPPNLSDVTVSGVARYPGRKRRHRSRLRNPRHGRESQSSDHGRKRDSNHVVLLGRQLMSPSNQYTCIVAVPRRRICLFNEQTVRFHLRKFSTA